MVQRYYRYEGVGVKFPVKSVTYHLNGPLSQIILSLPKYNPACDVTFLFINIVTQIRQYSLMQSYLAIYVSVN